MIIFHDPRCVEYASAGHPEGPARILDSVPLLRDRHPEWNWRAPDAARREELLRGHSPAHIERVEAALGDFDPDTPAHPDIYEHAARAAGAAIGVAREALRGNRSFSLMRPPGHHAMRDRAMGFCYFGNIAVAALDALEKGAERVAIWDFDAHHGNGTEDIVADHSRIAFASIHQFPGYPGTGTRSYDNVHNYPVAPLTPRAEHVRVVEQALEELTRFSPDLLLVSAGFDAYAGDPITEISLMPEDFAAFGKLLRGTELPTGAILEGGYSDKLPELIDAFLSSWNEG